MEQVQVKGPAGRGAKLAKELKPPSVGKWCAEGGQALLCATGVRLWRGKNGSQIHSIRSMLVADSGVRGQEDHSGDRGEKPMQ